MSGKAVLALSNASVMLGSEISEASHKKLYTKHHWNIDNLQGRQDDKTFDIEFEVPTSLLSLNIELTFNCKDHNKLLASGS